MRRSLSVVVITLGVLSMLFAAASGTATATFLTPTPITSPSSGVFADGAGPYTNNVGAVQSYFGAGGNNYDLVTYSTSPSRTLRFAANSQQYAIWNNAGLPTNFNAQVDFYGVNFFGSYASMLPGTTAQVHGVLQFHVGKNTYQLDYQSLAVMRDATTGVFHFTSDPASLPGYPGFNASAQAMLSQVRRNGNVNYGTVSMPIKFDVKP